MSLSCNYLKDTQITKSICRLIYSYHLVSFIGTNCPDKRQILMTLIVFLFMSESLTKDCQTQIVLPLTASNSTLGTWWQDPSLTDKICVWLWQQRDLVSQSRLGVKLCNSMIMKVFLPFLKLSWGNQSSPEVVVTVPSGLPPGVIFLAYNL